MGLENSRVNLSNIALNPLVSHRYESLDPSLSHICFDENVQVKLFNSVYII